MGVLQAQEDPAGKPSRSKMRRKKKSGETPAQYQLRPVKIVFVSVRANWEIQRPEITLHAESTSLKRHINAHGIRHLSILVV